MQYDRIKTPLGSFRCDENVKADYWANLDPSEYSQYKSDMYSEFNFYYPVNLYNNVQARKNPEKNECGNV